MHSWQYIQGAADDAEHWATFFAPPPSGGEGEGGKRAPLMLAPALFWAHVKAILPWTTTRLPWLQREEQQEEAPRAAGSIVSEGIAEEGEEDAAVERRVLALLVGAGDGGPPSTAAPELSERLWNVPGTALWIGHDDIRLWSRPWGGILRFVPFDKGAAAARRLRGQQQQHQEEEEQEEGRPGADDGAVVIFEEVDEGEGRRGELAREGLPRAIVAFRR